MGSMAPPPGTTPPLSPPPQPMPYSLCCLARGGVRTQLGPPGGGCGCVQLRWSEIRGAVGRRGSVKRSRLYSRRASTVPVSQGVGPRGSSVDRVRRVERGLLSIPTDPTQSTGRARVAHILKFTAGHRSRPPLIHEGSNFRSARRKRAGDQARHYIKPTTVILGLDPRTQRACVRTRKRLVIPGPPRDLVQNKVQPPPRLLSRGERKTAQRSGEGVRPTCLTPPPCHPGRSVSVDAGPSFAPVRGR